MTEEIFSFNYIHFLLGHNAKQIVIFQILYHWNEAEELNEKNLMYFMNITVGKKVTSKLESCTKI